MCTRFITLDRFKLFHPPQKDFTCEDNIDTMTQNITTTNKIYNEDLNLNVPDSSFQVLLAMCQHQQTLKACNFSLSKNTTDFHFCVAYTQNKLMARTTYIFMFSGIIISATFYLKHLATCLIVQPIGQTKLTEPRILVLAAT